MILTICRKNCREPYPTPKSIPAAVKYSNAVSLVAVLPDKAPIILIINNCRGTKIAISATWIGVIPTPPAIIENRLIKSEDSLLSGSFLFCA